MNAEYLAGEAIEGKRYRLIEDTGGVPVKAWIDGLPIEASAERQLRGVARLPFIHRWVAAMPDVHWGKGATIGSVIPTKGAIVPAAVGVDIGCGMMAVKTDLTASRLPENLRTVRSAIEKAIPHGRSHRGGSRDKGSWNDVPKSVNAMWKSLDAGYRQIKERHGGVAKARHITHLGTLGSGNHFIEICLDQEEGVWFMLHSGSRGIGNRIGTHFISLAQKDMKNTLSELPNRDLAYFREGTEHFDEYVDAVGWAQEFAAANRRVMMENMISAVQKVPGMPRFKARVEVINCHHNYVAKERHYGAEVYLTRKGAVRAGKGDMGIIPGSMGASSFIVRGLGNPESFESCSHGAGRSMSRSEAKRRFSVADHEAATAGVECRKDAGVIDETPAAYKSIDKVMAAQNDLVEIVYRLKQVVCVKG